MIKQAADNDNLFTSPELLMECRKILQQSGEKKASLIFENNFNMPPLTFNAIPIFKDKTTGISTFSGLTETY
jgi:hypothetical protein